MFSFLKDFGLPAYIVGVITLVALGYKKAKELQEHSLNTTKEQLDSITDLFSDEEKRNNAFIVEQVFHYKFKSYVPAKIIFRLLGAQNPTSSIKDYIYGRRHLKYDSGDIDISYHGKMSCSKYRKKWKLVNITGYFVFAFLGLGLLMFLPSLEKAIGFPWLIASIPLILYFLWVAYEFMTSAMRINAAERVMNEVVYDESHNKRV